MKLLTNLSEDDLRGLTRVQPDGHLLLNFCILLTDVKYFVHSFRMTQELEEKETENSVNDGREVRTSYNNVFL